MKEKSKPTLVPKKPTGQSFSADDHIKFIKSKEPIEAMKEANSVIGRKGRYKNLSHEEADRILKDTEDHIFQRDIPEEDFASGGLAGQLHLNQGGRIGFKEGKGHPTTGKGLHELVASTNYKPTAMEQILIDEYLGIPATYASGGLSRILGV